MGVIDFGNSNIGLITIAGVSYVVEDGKMREATADEIAAARVASATRKAARQQQRAERGNNGGINITMGDIAGGDIININIKK